MPLLLCPCYSEPFAALDLLGLSINGCPTSALALRSGRRLLLSNTHLKGSNAKDLAEDGGAALLAEIDEARHIFRLLYLTAKLVCCLLGLHRQQQQQTAYLQTFQPVHLC